jgi:hypothetical protein
MELYIQIRDGQPYEHPILGDNFFEAFPHLDTNNLPPEFARFERIEAPSFGVYEVLEGPVYQWVGDIVKDVWTVRPMTDEEKAVKVSELTQAAYASRDLLIVFAENQFTKAATDEQRQVWTEYITKLNNWTPLSLEDPAFLAPPLMTGDGISLSTTASGAAPNVIG